MIRLYKKINIKLYRQEYEKFMYETFGSYKITRMSMDLDAIIFRTNYMMKHNHKISEEMKETFSSDVTEFRRTLTEYVYALMKKQVAHTENIVDLIVLGVDMDQNYVTLNTMVIANNEKFLDLIDAVYREIRSIYPGKYFRFNTDSYNDGIAKAYPELFENKYQDVIGTGDDKDVFVHSFTFQTSERCSLNCSYCLGPDAEILMADGTEKLIRDIKVGDEVLSVDENIIHDENAFDNEWFYNEDRLVKTKVTKVFSHKDKLIAYGWRYYDSFEDINGNETVSKQDCKWITPNHPCLTIDRTFEQFEDIIAKNSGFVMFHPDHIVDSVDSHELIVPGYMKEEMVYNLETESHTYIADMLIVHNCYQFNKSESKMTFETAKDFIDHLLNDDYGYINRYNSPAIIIEFIGGEPLLEITLTRKIYEYFLDRCYELNHPWFTMHRLSICSNGMQYFDEEVQEFFKEYSSQISFNISIDGNKKLHDSCRIQPNGEGSYDIDMMALNHYNKHFTAERNSKMTLAPSNISYLYDSVVNFINNGMTTININCVFEEGWEPKHATIEYNQLKKLADYILKNDLEHLYIAIFNERQEDRMDKHNDSSYCGGNGSMLALRANGEFYPCLRYMPSSVGPNRDSMCIGTVKDGMNDRSNGSKVLQKLDRITRRGQNTDICFECPLSNECASCLALGHTVFNNPNKRTTFTCIMVIAEHLANVYYWNNMLVKHPKWDLMPRRLVTPDEWSLLVIDKEELELLKNLEALAMMTYMERKGTRN